MGLMENHGLWRENYDLWRENYGLWRENYDLWREKLWFMEGKLWFMVDINQLDITYMNRAFLNQLTTGGLFMVVSWEIHGSFQGFYRWWELFQGNCFMVMSG